MASQADWSGAAAAASAGSCAEVAVRATGCTSGQFGQLGPQSRDFLLHLEHLVGPLGQPRPRPLVGTCGGGCWASPAASPAGANGRRRSAGSGGRMPGGACIFAPSIWSGSTCDAKPGSTFAMSCALLVPGGAKIGAPPGILPPDPADFLRPRAGPEEAPGERTSAGASKCSDLLQQ